MAPQLGQPCGLSLIFCSALLCLPALPGAQAVDATSSAVSTSTAPSPTSQIRTVTVSSDLVSTTAYSTTTMSIPSYLLPDDDDHCSTYEENDRSDLQKEYPLCEIGGNPDFYGLGVRLGIYFAWLTSWVSNNFLPDEMSGSFDTNSIFLAAIGVTVLYLSNAYEILIIDALILLQLSFGFVFGVMSLWGYRTMWYKREGANGQKRFGGWGTHFRLLLCCGISIYSLWFWTRGLTGGLPKCKLRPECGGIFAFTFTSASVFGPVKTIYTIASAACCLYYGIMVLVALAAATKHAWCWLRCQEQEWIPQDMDVDDGFDARQLTIAFIALSAFNLIWIVFIGVTVEVTLNINHVVGVLGNQGLVGPGQLLPMFIGLLSFVRVLYLLFKEYIMERQERRKERLERQQRLYGLGVSGTTVEGTPPTRKRTGFGSLKRSATGRWNQRHKADMWHRIFTAWLPWLSCFVWWRQLGKGADFHLLRSGPTGSSTAPEPNLAMTGSTQVELDSPVGKNVDTPVSARNYDDGHEVVDTEYHGHEHGHGP